MARAGRLRPLWRWLISCGTAGVLLGCQRSPGPDMFPVKGQVTLDGKPLTTGRVSFKPDAARGNTTMHLPFGVIDDKGRYELVTANRPGAPPGWYKVLIFADNFLPDTKKGSTTETPVSLVPARYVKPQETDLAVEVVANPQPGAYDLKLRP